MTTKQALQTPALQTAWEKYKGLRVQGIELIIEGYYLQGGKSQARGRECWAQADRLWDKAVRDVYGNMSYKWVQKNPERNSARLSYECLLANGEVYEFTLEWPEIKAL